MKRKILVLLPVVAMLLLCTMSCSKQKTCRCAVRGTSTVRIIKIEKGECDQLNHLEYQSPLYVPLDDSLVCTDYEFHIDSIYND